MVQMEQKPELNGAANRVTEKINGIEFYGPADLINAMKATPDPKTGVMAKFVVKTDKGDFDLNFDDKTQSVVIGSNPEENMVSFFSKNKPENGFQIRDSITVYKDGRPPFWDRKGELIAQGETAVLNGIKFTGLTEDVRRDVNISLLDNGNVRIQSSFDCVDCGKEIESVRIARDKDSGVTTLVTAEKPVDGAQKISTIKLNNVGPGRVSEKIVPTK